MASNIHLKLGDVKGESTDDKHKDEIDIESWSWGAGSPESLGAGGGAATGKVSFTDLTFVHSFDRASPSLWKACATGEHFKEARLSSRKQGKGQQDFLVITLKEILVTSVNVSESNGAGSPPMEVVSIRFGKVDMEYKPQKADGSLGGGIHFRYDLKAHKEG